MVEWNWDEAFVVSGTVTVSAAVLWGVRSAVAQRNLICRALSAFTKGSSQVLSNKNEADVKYLNEQIAIEKKKLAVKVPRTRNDPMKLSTCRCGVEISQAQ